MKKIAQVFKIHSDFYYVKFDNTIIECKLKDTLKKQQTEVFVGDFVVLDEINLNSNQAFISQLEPRKSYIPRPKVANIEQIIIVSALKEPDLNFEQLNRYLCLCEYYKIKPILCFNKNDLSDDKKFINNIKKLYSSLGYETIFTSAIEKVGISAIQNILAEKTSALCGLSGVGKSTLINTINPKLKLKTNKVSEKTNRGTHTTRHCEIISLKLDNGKEANIIDTPGFSCLKFDFLLPKDVSKLFPEIEALSKTCKYSDCLHIQEAGCNVKANLNKIDNSRYQSYITFIEEAKEFKEKITYQGHKKEDSFKLVNNKKFTKIGTKSREKARNTEKQAIKTKEDTNG